MNFKSFFTRRQSAPKSKSKSKSKTRRRSLATVERLERRELFAAAVFDAGTLYLEGDDADNTAAVSVVGSDVVATIESNGSSRSASAPASQVHRIVFNGHGGDDHFQNNTSVPALAWGHEGDDTLIGGSGNDQLVGQEGNDNLQGRRGHDQIWGAAGNDQIMGGSGDDVLIGNEGNDIIDGAAGADRIWGASGNDLILGGQGNDLIYGGYGNDQIFGDEGDDRLLGEHGVDRVFGDLGNDILEGGYDNDWLYGGLGNDRLYGHEGNDTLAGGAGEDWLHGGDAADSLFGGDGKDRLYGDGGADFLNGNAGPDLLAGGWGDDQLYGGSGQDLLMGEQGNDYMEGGQDGNGSRSDSILGDGGRVDYFYDWQGSNTRSDRSWSNGHHAPQAYHGLAQRELESHVAAAAENWRQVGAHVDPSTAYRVADLPEGTLGFAVIREDGSHVVLVDNSPGQTGWHIDATPHANEEFFALTNHIGWAHPNSSASHSFDLLTVVQHEMGHVLGLEHSDKINLMFGGLADGVRMLPDAALVGSSTIEVGMHASTDINAYLRQNEIQLFGRPVHTATWLDSLTGYNGLASLGVDPFQLFYALPYYNQTRPWGVTGGFLSTWGRSQIPQTDLNNIIHGGLSHGLSSTPYFLNYYGTY